MTNPALAIEPVRRSIEVELPAAEAFALYTEEMGEWWPKSHHIGKAEFVTVVVEPKAGGRVYEVSPDGTECDWGKVLEWDPPRRLVTSWHLDGDWTFHADPARASEVVVSFVPMGEGATRVELEHRHFERHDHAAALAEGVGSPGGWTLVLEGYVARAKRAGRKS
jgi:uncharacterized protein YndB with AHSA1/START domain